MKIRLAKKIALTPINRLAPKWLAAAFVGGKDERIAIALRKAEKYGRKN